MHSGVFAHFLTCAQNSGHTNHLLFIFKAPKDSKTAKTKVFFSLFFLCCDCFSLNFNNRGNDERWMEEVELPVDEVWYHLSLDCPRLVDQWLFLIRRLALAHWLSSKKLPAHLWRSDQCGGDEGDGADWSLVRFFLTLFHPNSNEESPNTAAGSWKWRESGDCAGVTDERSELSAHRSMQAAISRRVHGNRSADVSWHSSEEIRLIWFDEDAAQNWPQHSLSPTTQAPSFTDVCSAFSTASTSSSVEHHLSQQSEPHMWFSASLINCEETEDQ